MIVTNQNPHFKGLVDIHKCIYLPSGHDNVSVSGEASSTAKVINIILVLLGYVVIYIYVYIIYILSNIDCAIHGATRHLRTHSWDRRWIIFLYS